MKRQKSFSNKDDAESFLRRMSAKDAGITLSRCISTYIEAHPEMTKKRSKEYQILIQYNGIAETLKDRETTSLTDEDLNSIRVFGTQQGLSPQTINYKTGLLKTIFTWAKQNNLIDDVPWLYSKKNEVERRKL